MHAIREGSAAEVRDVLLRAIDVPYPLERVIDEKLRDGYQGHPSFLLAATGGRIEGGAVLCGQHLRLLGVAPDARSRGVGSALLQEAERRISKSFARIVIASEPGNYFTPGVLEAQSGFFHRRGYSVSADSVNLFAPTGSYPANRPSRARPSDQIQLLDFVEGHFGRIWRFETARAFEHEVPTVVFIEESGAIAGFSAWAANNAALGSYGPSGLARSHRGKGLGRELLLASLSHMHADGFGEALIQWAAAIDFYQRAAGARVAHRFLVMEKRFRP